MTENNDAARLTRSLTDIAAIVGSLATVAGFALVALARTGLNWFYANFALTPEEVGLDQSSILLQTASAGLVVVVFAMVVGMLVGVAVARRLGRPVASIRTLAADRGIMRICGLVALSILVLYFLWGVTTARESLERVRAGRSTNPQMIAHGEVTARCVQVWWKEPHLDEVFGKPRGSRFVYLGEAHGKAAFYDSQGKRTMRVSGSEVATRSC
jgi:hypothetical protein